MLQPRFADIRFRAVKGLVGKQAALAYQQYENDLKLPDYELVLNSPESIDWDGLSVAEQKLVLDMVVGRMTATNLVETVHVLEVFKTATDRVDLIASIIALFNSLIKRLELEKTRTGSESVMKVYRLANQAHAQAGLVT